jgi:hypothetical protein
MRDKMYRPERDGAKVPMKSPTARPMKPMDKMYRPERDGLKRPMMSGIANPTMPKMNAIRRIRKMKKK